MDIYIKGESIVLEISLTDEETGQAIDLSTLSSIEMTVRHVTSETTLKTGSVSGGEVVKGETDAAGIIYMFIESTLTASANVGDYEYLVTTTKADTRFDNNIFVGKYRESKFEITS